MITRKRFSTQQRRQHIRAWQHSGLSKVAYAHRHGLNIKTFSNWTRQQPTASADGNTFIPARITVVPVEHIVPNATLNLTGCSVTASPAALVDIIRGLNLC